MSTAATRVCLKNPTSVHFHALQTRAHTHPYTLKVMKDAVDVAVVVGVGLVLAFTFFRISVTGARALMGHKLVLVQRFFFCVVAYTKGVYIFFIHAKYSRVFAYCDERRRAGRRQTRSNVFKKTHRINAMHASRIDVCESVNARTLIACHVFDGARTYAG